jgi:hypothetical protein
VFCVNVDAVIAALLLAILWKDYKSGALTEKDLETAAFNVFLYGRMIGAAAEIDDHLNPDLLISDGCDWSGVIAKLFAKSMRPARKAG